MRSLERRKQDIWFVTRTKDDSNIEPSFIYSKPIKKRMSVSDTSGSRHHEYYGAIPTYDRYLITYEHGFKPNEGTYVYVDAIPEIDRQGNLVLLENGDPTVKPDYVVDRLAWTEKGTKTRIGIKLLSDGDFDG